MIESVRARLTLWYVGVLAAVLGVVCVMIYVLLARALRERIDENLRAVAGIAVTSLTNDLAEGQGTTGAAKSTAAELVSDQASIAIYDGSGRLLASEGEEDLSSGLPLEDIDDERLFLATMAEEDDADERHRVAIQRVHIRPTGTEFILRVSSDLERTDDELEELREVLLYVVPAALLLAGIVGWFMARQSLAPVVLMAERARRIGVENLGGRLPVANPKDELGRLAETFNELLSRLATSFSQQRQFMADASHELRTPVATARTAAAVTLQQPHRAEPEYRESLEIIEEQTSRLTRIVEDMFTLARADAGNYPVKLSPVYLDELVEEVARSAAVLAARKRVSVEQDVHRNAAFTGDEDLLRRMVANLVDNAVKHAPSGTSVRVTLESTDGRYHVRVFDQGPGIPQHQQAHVFDRFFRGDAARGRVDGDPGGAGLGLAIARWIARQHGGDVMLEESTGSLTVFRIELPARSQAA